MRLVMLKDIGFYRVGQRVTVSPKAGREMIAKGYAKEADWRERTVKKRGP